MTIQQEWVNRVTLHGPELRALIRTYHPAISTTDPHQLKITAPNAERAAITLRRAARKPAPLERFDQALVKNDLRGLWNVLHETWTGVPESLEAWKVPGFPVLVELLDDYPN